MKCLSLFQPWAQLVVLGLKRYETRPWTTRHRGPLLIHASRRRPARPEERGPTGFHMPELDGMYRDLASRGYGVDDLPLGAIIGGVVVQEVYHTEDLEPLAERIGEAEMLVGNFAPDRFAWRLIHPFRLAEPIPWRGRQRLFDVELPPELEELAREAARP